jgi:RNA polymerase sigma factor for flagellar operon FliA
MGTLQQIERTGRMSQDALLALWRQYKEAGDLRARDRLIFSLAPIVKHIVYRKVREIPAYREVDDFLSCGIEALLRAIDRYDPEKGATIEQYAWTRIHGAVLDELRRYDWAPRSVRRLEREMNKARDRFTVLHGRAPSHAELSDALAISKDELEALLDDLARCEVGSLNTFVIGDDDSPSERLDTLASLDLASNPEHAAMREGALERFREAFEKLSPREQTVAVMLHVRDLTLRETGEILGVSESRVCQIHGKLKRGLRESLEADAPLLHEVA